MKAKNIKSVLSRKIADFAEHIEDKTVRSLVEQNTIVTGGAIASMLLREDVNDFDLYFRTREATLAVARYFVAKFRDNPPPRFKNGKSVEIFVDDTLPDRIRTIVKSAGVASENGDEGYKYFEGDMDPGSTDAADYVDAATNVLKDKEQAEEEKKPKYRPVFLSTNAITLSHQIQLVTRFFGNPDEIHANYDFVHCTNYWTSWDKNLVLRPEALEALLARELRYVGSKYPLCSIIRTRKFIKRNWSITAGQYLKMAMQLNELDLKDPSVLEEQLTGVDTAYFQEILAKLKERDPSRVDTTYLVELIDRLF
jgi:hypothetical protein